MSKTPKLEKKNDFLSERVSEGYISEKKNAPKLTEKKNKTNMIFFLDNTGSQNKSSEWLMNFFWTK